MHSLFRLSLQRAALAVATAFLAAVPAGHGAQAQMAAQEHASSWAPGNLARARLIAGPAEGPAWKAGVEVQLKGNAHTYWRQPGDAGIPPQFDFSQSANLEKAQPLFPAPKRGGKPGEEFIGYEKTVIFPVVVTPKDPGKPVDLRLTLNYAACEKICVPERAVLRLRLAPGRTNSTHASAITRYLAQTPQPFSAPAAPALTVRTVQPGKSWQVSVTPASVQPVDLFVELDENWFFETRKVDSGFIVTAVQKPENSSSVPQVLLTLTTGRGAFEGRRQLP